MATIMAGGLTVTFAELGVRDGESPVISCDRESVSVSRQLIVDWDDLIDTLWQLIGYSYLDETGELHRVLPQEDWAISGLYATRANRAKGIAWREKFEQENGSTNAFKKAAIDVDFMPLPFNVLEDDEVIGEDGSANEFKRFVEVETIIEGDYLSLNDGNTGIMQYAEGPNSTGSDKTFPGTIGQIVCRVNYVFRWHAVPDAGLPEETILDTIGKVNQTDFGDTDTFRLSFPAGTLLLLGGSWRRIFMLTPDGVKKAWTIEYMAKYSPQGHNKVFDWHRNARVWVQISIDGTLYPPGSVPDGKTIYGEREFADMFDTTAG